MSNVNPLDFFERESMEFNDDDTPPPTENDSVDDETNEDPPMDDTATKDGDQPKADGATDAATETPKRARPEQDAEDIAATNLGVTKSQLAKAKELIEKAAKQGLSFQDDTTISLTDTTQVWKTTEQSFEFTRRIGAKSKEFAVIATVVFDPTKGYEGMPRVPMSASSVNFANSASNKFRPTFVLHSCKDIDPNEHFEADKVLRRIKELETIGHKGSIKTATALVQTFQERKHTAPTEPGYADKWANYAIHNFPNWSPTVDHDGRTVLKFTNKVWCNMVPGQNDDNFHHYPTFFGDNSLFTAAHATGKVVDAIPMASIEEDGTIKELNIINTHGFTLHLLQPGDKCVLIVKPTHKSGEKYSALELSINYIYKLPFPREHINLDRTSAPSSASSTPVKSPQPMQPTERPAKVTKIIFD